MARSAAVTVRREWSFDVYLAKVDASPKERCHDRRPSHGCPAHSQTTALLHRSPPGALPAPSADRGPRSRRLTRDPPAAGCAVRAQVPPPLHRPPPGATGGRRTQPTGVAPAPPISQLGTGALALVPAYS